MPESALGEGGRAPPKSLPAASDRRRGRRRRLRTARRACRAPIAVGARVHHYRIGAEGTALQIDLVVAQRLANLVEIVDRGRRRVLRKIEALLQLAAAGPCDLRVEGRLEISLQM